MNYGCKLIKSSFLLWQAQFERCVSPSWHMTFSIRSQSVRGADVYFRFIRHNWSDKYAMMILSNLIPAMKDGERVVIYTSFSQQMWQALRGRTREPSKPSI